VYREGSKCDKGLREYHATPCFVWCRLQDSNPPPDDYKASTNIKQISHLPNFSIYKDAATTACESASWLDLVFDCRTRGLVLPLRPFPARLGVAGKFISPLCQG